MTFRPFPALAQLRMKPYLLASLLLASAAPAFAQQSTAALPPPVLVDPKVAALRDDALETTIMPGTSSRG